MSLKDKIKESRLIAWLYSQEQDFNNGRGFFGKITSLSNEINTILIVFLGWETFKTQLSELSTIMFGGLLFIYLFGKVYRRMNLLEADQRASANRSPIGKLHLHASEIIIARFGGEEDYEKQIRKKI